ncbi:hypothetical protein Tco_0000984 [Tanacetum coccineum]
MDNPNITMEEYIRLEEEKARKCRKVFNWETARYGKIWYDVEVHDLRFVETEFPAIVFNDSLTSNETLSYEPTVQEFILVSSVLVDQGCDGVNVLDLFHWMGGKSDRRLSCGHLLGGLAYYFGMVCLDRLRDSSMVASGPERQQAPQPPPPPPTAGRTMPQRLGRLKEEIQGLRRDVWSLRGLVERSMNDQSRVSTWMISCMTQLMEASGQTY